MPLSGLERWVPERRRSAAAALLVLAALVAFLFHEILFQGRVLYERDLSLLLYGQSETFARTLLSGSWPLWDPWVSFGQPMLANPGAQVLYPWTWLNLIVLPETAYTFYATSHVALAGGGVYALCRHAGLGAPAALAAGATFMLSGPFLSLVSLWQHLAGAAWIPWVLVGCRAALGTPSAQRVVLWALACAGQVATGSVEMCAIAALLQAGLLLHHLRAAPQQRRQAAGAVLKAAALAAALTAGLWLPAAELLQRSARGEMTEGQRAYWSLHPVNLIQVAVPAFPQTLPLQPEVRALLYERREPFLGSVYLGLACLPLAGLALVGPRWRLAGTLAALGAGAALFALGRFGVAYPLLTELVPPLRIFRFPSKAMVLAAFAWALLVGLGLEALRAPKARRRALGLLGAAAAIGVALLAVRAPVWAPAFLAPGHSAPPSALLAPAVTRMLVAAALALASGAFLLVVRRGGPGVPAALAVADLLLVHRPLNPSVVRELIFRRPEVVEALRLDDAASRVYAFDYFFESLSGTPRREMSARRTNAPGLDAHLQATLYSLDALLPPTNRRWGLYGSFDVDWLQLYAPEVRTLTLVLREQDRGPELRRLLELGGVSRVVALHREGLEGFRERARVESPFAGTVHVYDVPAPLPRAYVVAGTRIADGPSALATLVDPGFDPAREVVLADGTPQAPSDVSVGNARILPGGYRPDRVALEARLQAPGFLVLIDAYDPGWQAYVDGRAAPLLRANTAFRAVALPAGTHRVEMRYRPPLAVAGLCISGAALALVGWLLARAARAP